MSGISKSIIDNIGNTPMVYLSEKTNTTKARIALKLESENPMASVKDRLGISIIREAEKEGKITPGVSTLVEATSGNTGIALAQLGARLGYKVILTMPETMSQERRAVLSIFGAKVVLTPASKGMAGAVSIARKIAAETPGSFLTEQFATPANPKIHRETTGPEVYKQTDGKLDYFVAGVGTGGTLIGTAQYLKSVGASTKIVAVEPAESPVLSGGKPGPHKIAGIGAGFVPAVYDPSLVSEIVQVTSDEALAMAKAIPQAEGLFCGISGGAAIVAALKLASRPEADGKLIVAIIPSFGERYLSTALFNEIRESVAKWPVEPVENC